MTTNKTDFFISKLDKIYDKTLKELKKQYGEEKCEFKGYEYKYELVFALLKTPIFLDFIDTLFTKEKFNITTDDIKEHLDLDPRFITLKFNSCIDYMRFPEGAYQYFEDKGNLSLIEKEKLKRKIVFYNQDSYSKFLKENIYLVNESKKINIDTNKLKIDDTLTNDIDIDELIKSEINAIEKEYYKNSNIKKNISNIDEDTINKILNKEINFLTTNTVKSFTKEDIIERQRIKLISYLKYKKRNGYIDTITYNYEIDEINKNYNSYSNIYNYKNTSNEAYDKQMERFLHNHTYKEYNLYLENNSNPIRLFHFELEETDELNEDIKSKHKYSIDKAAWYENIEENIIQKVQSKIDKKIINKKKEIATNKRAKEELQLKKALKNENLKQEILNTNKNNHYYNYIVDVIEKLSQED